MKNSGRGRKSTSNVEQKEKSNEQTARDVINIYMENLATAIDGDKENEVVGEIVTKVNGNSDADSVFPANKDTGVHEEKAVDGEVDAEADGNSGRNTHPRLHRIQIVLQGT